MAWEELNSKRRKFVGSEWDDGTSCVSISAEAIRLSDQSLKNLKSDYVLVFVDDENWKIGWRKARDRDEVLRAFKLRSTGKNSKKSIISTKLRSFFKSARLGKYAVEEIDGLFTVQLERKV